MDARTVIEEVIEKYAFSSGRSGAVAILAALKEAGYAVIRVEPKAWDDVLKRAEALDELGEMDGQLLD